MGGVAKSGKVAAKSSSAPAGSSLVDWLFRPAMLFRLSLVAGACALWPYAAQKLPSLGKRAEYKLKFNQIQISPSPDRPVPMNLVEQVQELTNLASELSILDQEVTLEIAQAFRRHPWVSKVVRVRKSFPAAITVELEYRQPVAMVQVTGGRIPIDIEGYVLPSVDFSPGDTARYPLIQNAVSKSTVVPGSAWNDPAIIAASRLANLLGEKWKLLKLEAILIPRNVNSTTATNDIPLELLGHGGSRIVWGRTPGSDHPGELEPTQKIRRLEKYLSDFGDYGLPNGPYEIDIRHWQKISRHPLANDQSKAKSAKGVKDEARHINNDAKKKTRS